MVKNLPANAGDTGDTSSVPGSGRSPGGRSGNSVFLPGKSHGQRSLAGYISWGGKELDMAVQWLRLGLPRQGVKIQSLIWEPRPHICSQKTKTYIRSSAVTN